MSRVVAVLTALCAVAVFAASAGAKVLRVGTYHGMRGQFSSVQAAVKAAKPGDWILVGPGDYKTKSAARARRAQGHPRGCAAHQAPRLPARHEPQQGDHRRDQVGSAVQPRSA